MKYMGIRKMKNEQIINYEEALEEKRQMQKILIRDNGYPSSVLALLIAYFEKQLENR